MLLTVTFTCFFPSSMWNELFVICQTNIFSLSCPVVCSIGNISQELSLCCVDPSKQYFNKCFALPLIERVLLQECKYNQYGKFGNYNKDGVSLHPFQCLGSLNGEGVEAERWNNIPAEGTFQNDILTQPFSSCLSLLLSFCIFSLPFLSLHPPISLSLETS